MSVDVSEKNLERTIECALLAGGPDACPEYHAVHETPAEYLPGGYRRRAPEHYDAALCLDPDMAVRVRPGHAAQGVGPAPAAARRRRP